MASTVSSNKLKRLRKKDERAKLDKVVEAGTKLLYLDEGSSQAVTEFFEVLHKVRS